jgi:hypothetical protein
MSDLSEIYDALMDGKRAAESLDTWVTGADARDVVRHRLRSIDRGINAYNRLAAQLRDGRKHVEPPEDWRPTGCMCSWPTVSPPCSWCTDPDRSEDEEA